MKKGSLFRRIGALAIAVMMALSLAVPAMATEAPTGKITVQNALTDGNYVLYKVLSLDYEANDGDAARRATYKYTYVDALKAVLAGVVGQAGLTETGTFDVDGGSMQYKAGFSLPETGNMLVFNLMVRAGDAAEDAAWTLATDDQAGKWQVSKSGQAYSRKFGEALKAAVLGDATALAALDGHTATAANGKVEFAGLDRGYYLLDSDKGKYVMADTVIDSEVLIVEKTSVPKVESKDAKDGNGEYVDTNDAAIGDDVQFRVVIDTGANVSALKFTDTLGEGLTLKSLDGIVFYPRTVDGKFGYTDGRAVYANSKPSSAGDEAVGGVILVAGEGFAPPMENYMDDGEDVVEYGAGWLVVDHDEAVAGQSMSVFALDATAKVVDDGSDTLTVDFAPQWLASNRGENEDTSDVPGEGETYADVRGKFTAAPMTVDSDRLAGYGDYKPADVTDEEFAAGFNVYTGDAATLADDGGKIVIYYTATVNERAKVSDPDGNKNSAKVEYKNDPTDEPEESEPDTTTTYVYGTNVVKFDQADNKVVLQGAEFTVKKLSEGDVPASYVDKANGEVTVPAEVLEAAGVELKFVADGANGYKLTQAADVTGVALVTGTDGKLVVKGLDSGVYAFTETKAPDGYIIADEPIYFVIGGVDSETVTDGVADVYTMNKEGKFVKAAAGTTGAQLANAVNISNASGMIMPETGGIGTTIFYACGGVLVLVAAAVFVTLKKRSANSGK